MSPHNYGENGNGESTKKVIGAYFGERIVIILSIMMLPVVSAVVLWVVNIDDKMDDMNIRISIMENEHKALHDEVQKIEQTLDQYVNPFPTDIRGPRR